MQCQLRAIFDRDAATSISRHVGCAPESGRNISVEARKLAANDLAFNRLASIRLWLRVGESAL
jgi:hypothetical protein